MAISRELMVKYIREQYPFGPFSAKLDKMPDKQIASIYLRLINRK